MNQHSYHRLLKLLIGAVLVFSAFAANAQSGDPVTIKSVDNYGGNSNVTTNKPNATVTVTELDADKKPVRSWTGTTDGEGKITIPAGSNLSAPYLRARTADPKMAEFVLPTSVGQNEPFMFAATGVVEGEVVSVQTVEGEVVATKKADKHGRVFLATGLAAGSYLLSAGDGRSNRVGTIQVSPSNFGNSVDPVGPLSINLDSPAIDMSKFGTIEGNFPNLSSLDLDDFVSTRTVPILAATQRQIVFDRPANLGVKPGDMTLTVRDTATGQSATADVVFYSASAKLTNVKVPSGSQTHLVVTVLPKELEGDVSATILGGPVAFANGEGAMTLTTSGGQADFALQSQPGSAGKFDVSWSFNPTELLSKFWDPFRKIWEPARRGLKTHVWDPLIKKLNELDWTPPKGGGGAKKDDPPKKEDPPKVDEKKPDPPRKGGDTKALPPKWEPFQDKDDKGNVTREGMKKSESKDGVDTTIEIYAEGNTTVKKTVTVKGDVKTEVTEKSSKADSNGKKTETTETVISEKIDGKWVEKSRKTVTK